MRQFAISRNCQTIISKEYDTHSRNKGQHDSQPRGITQRQLAEVTGISYSVINEVLNGKRPVTIEYALLIGKALDVDSMPLVNMQSDYDMQMAQRNKTLIARLNNMRKIAAVL